MTSKHLEILLDELRLKNRGKVGPWVVDKKTKRLASVFDKLRYGSMTPKQMNERWERIHEQAMNADIDWGDDE